MRFITCSGTFVSGKSETSLRRHPPPLTQCFGVPVRDRSGFRGAKRQFVHRSYVLKPLLQLKAWQVRCVKPRQTDGACN